MSEDTQKDIDNRLKALRARIRMRRRKAHQQDAGLFLQMTITADLIHRGELGEDEYVKIERDANDGLVARKVKIDDEVM